MTTEQVILDGDKHDIPVRPLTMLFGFDGLMKNPEYPNRIVIEPATANKHIEWCKEWHPSTAAWVRRIIDTNGGFSDEKAASMFTPEHINQAGAGAKSAAGFVDVSLRLRDAKVPVVLRFPESSLHPASQAEMMEFIYEELMPKDKGGNQ